MAAISGSMIGAESSATYTDASLRSNARRHKEYVTTAIDVNQANTDVATITGLPAKYRVLRFMIYDASTSLTTATGGVFTAAAGGGTAIVANAALSALTAASKFSDMTVATSADYQTATTLYIRCGTAQGGAATMSALLEILDLV